MSRAHLFKLSALTAAFLVAGLTACGLPDVDRTQPNKVRKDLFDGEWYFRQTVIDVPATSGLSFIGEQGSTERVRWEITEDVLFAYRAYPFQEGGDGHVRPGTGPYTDAPIAAFPILSHFDVQRQYNPQTGEQSNVLYEDTQDRPWWEREYMRVLWHFNLIADFQFTASAVHQQPVTFAIPEEDDPSRPSKDQAKIGADYIDIVHRITAQPELNQLYTNYFGFPILECWLYDSVHQDCLGAELRIRSSFMKVPEGQAASDYMALEYDDLRFQKFGYFRAERYGYNPEYGVVEPAATRLANRFNVWKDAASCYDPEADLPYSACSPDQLRTIVYYLNEDFPEELRSGALENGDEWNRVFREAVMAGTGWTEEQLGDTRLFRICPNNPVKAGDPKECGEAGLSPQIGDLRYSMYYYVPDAQESSPLGYGPSAQDPLTGETIQGNAFYYGAPGKWIAARTRDILKYELGLLDDDDITGGLPAREAVAKVRARADESRSRFAEQYSKERVKELADRLQLSQVADRLHRQIETGEAFLDLRAGRLERLDDTSIDEMLMTQDLTDLVRVLGVERDDGTGSLSYEGMHDMKKLLSPEFFNYFRAREQRLLSPKAGGCILMAEDVFDAGLLGLLTLVKREFYDTSVDPPVLKDGKTEDDVLQFIARRTMMDTQLHEIGHTVGLRHNFSGSTDALNFGPKYWELRGPGYTMAAGDKRPLPLWQLDGAYKTGYEQALVNGIMDYQDSSVMDYASTYGTNTALGLYDAAAIKYAYFDVVETFNSPDITKERAQLLRQGELHYTYYPEVVSNGATYEDRIAAMYDRGHVNWRKTDPNNALYDDNLVEVPYSFCSDEYREGSAVCFTWDSGADNWERTTKMIDDYRHYVIFDSFKRERVGFGVDVFSYLSRIYSRKYAYMLYQYKNWVNDELIIRDDRPCRYVEDGQVVSEPDRFTNTPCGEAGLMGAIETLNLFGEVMQTPDVGCYVRLKPGCYETTATNETGISDRDVTLVDNDPAFCDTFTPVQTDPDSPRMALKITSTTEWEHVPDSTSCEGWAPIVDTADSNLVLSEEPIQLGLGDARPAISLYDRQKYGYYFYWKPVLMGAWWDKWIAVKALGDPDTDFIGVDASSDTRSFLISLNTLFGEEINNLLAGIATENTNVYAPQVNATGDGIKYVPTIALVQTDDRDPNRAVINPDQQYTFRLLAMFNGAYQSQYTDDLEFQETLRAGRAYAVTDVDVPASIRNDPTRYVQLSDPETGYIYYGIRRDRTFQDGTPIYSTAYEFIREIKDRYYVGGADGPGTQLKDGFFDWQPQGDIRMLELMIGTDAAFGHMDVWSGDVGF